MGQEDTYDMNVLEEKHVSLEDEKELKLPVEITWDKINEKAEENPEIEAGMKKGLKDLLWKYK